MNKLKSAIMLTLSIMVLSCSGGDDSGNDPGNNPNGGGKDKYAYCVYMEQRQCLSGPFETCTNGGTPSNSCPTGYDTGSQNSSSSGGSGNGNLSSSSGYTYSYGSLTYQGQTYKTVVIGTQTWMAENLNYNAAGSACYNNLESNCNKYGRLYEWSVALVVCPSSWHLPNNAEWGALMRFVNPSCSLTGNCSNAGTKLKATSGWDTSSDYNYILIPGTDDFGFSALPSGVGGSGGSFSGIGNIGFWWSSSSENYSGIILYYYSEDAYWDYGSKSYGLYSIRCIKD